MREQLMIRWKKELLAATIDYPKILNLGINPLYIICHGFIG